MFSARGTKTIPSSEPCLHKHTQLKSEGARDRQRERGVRARPPMLEVKKERSDATGEIGGIASELMITSPACSTSET